ncbi:MAG: hypothetical protein ABEJ31_12900 [Haloarculaceae archaeon]
MATLIDELQTPSFLAAWGALAGYVAILVGMFVLLFLVPYVVFTLLL